jgi:hypothetical protein
VTLLAAGGIASVVALVGCAPAATPEPAADGARQAITAFVEALSDGNLADAVELSTSAATDFACTSMVSNDADIAMAAPAVVSVEENGDTATAQVTYSAPSEQSEQFDLVREGEHWLVELPDSFELVIGFDAPVVADLVIDDDCTVPVEDSKTTLRAWPGTYRIDIVDPTGVLGRTEQMLYAVPGASITGVDGDPSSLPAVPEGDLSVLRAESSSLLSTALAECIAADFTAADCPAALVGATPIDGAVPTGEYNTIDRLWTDDGRQWRFETGIGTIETTAGGAAQQVAFSYAGTLGTARDGALTLQFSR